MAGLVLALVDAVGQQPEHVAGLEPQCSRPRGRAVGEEAHRHRCRADPFERSIARVPVQQRSLPCRVVRDLVGPRVENTEKRGHTAVRGEVLDELIVDVPVRVVDRGTEAHGDPEHRPDLGHAEGGPDSVSRGVADENDEPVIGQREEVERISPGLFRRPAQAHDVVSREGRGRSRKQGDLDVTSDGQLAVELFFGHDLLGHLRATDGDGALSRERRRCALVVEVERALDLVEDLQDSDERPVVSDERHGEQAPRAVPGLPVGLRVEPRVSVAIRDVDHAAGPGALAGDAPISGKAQSADAGGHGRGELMTSRVVQEHRPPIGPQDDARGVDDLPQEIAQLNRRRETTRHLEDPLERGGGQALAGASCARHASEYRARQGGRTARGVYTLDPPVGRNARPPRYGAFRVSHPVEITGPLRLSIVRTIAHGGMGHVYQAVQHGVEGFSKTVAVKTILERYSGDEEFVRMFIAEAKLVADLVHQNIVQVYHLGRASKILYIVMEYVEGMNLHDVLARHRETGRRLPIELAAFIASRVCRGLEYAHKQTARDGTPLGVVHRDISPRNLLVTWFGEVKIGDFGIAKARSLTIDEEEGRLLGKYAYLSPEQARLEPTDKRSDLFSLGLVLWEMIVGRRAHPPDPRTREEWLERVRTTTVPAIADHAPDVPEMLGAIVDRAVSMDRAARYSDAGTMGYDLEYFMYHKGYGPTIVTLASYLADVFPEMPQENRKERSPRQDGDLPTPTETTRSAPRPRRRTGGR